MTGQCGSCVADIALYVLLQLGKKYGVVTLANFKEIMSLIEDPHDQLDQAHSQLDCQLPRAAQVSLSPSHPPPPRAPIPFVAVSCQTGQGRAGQSLCCCW